MQLDRHPAHQRGVIRCAGVVDPGRGFTPGQGQHLASQQAGALHDNPSVVYDERVHPRTVAQPAERGKHPFVTRARLGNPLPHRDAPLSKGLRRAIRYRWCVHRRRVWLLDRRDQVLVHPPIETKDRASTANGSTEVPVVPHVGCGQWVERSTRYPSARTGHHQRLARPDLTGRDRASLGPVPRESHHGARSPSPTAGALSVRAGCIGDRCDIFAREPPSCRSNGQ